jgi:anaerobic selenocysteine-containing dehydrogenase
MAAEIRHSVCALDCPDACAMLVKIEDGKATQLRGDPAHPITRGFLCAKVTRYLDREYSPERLLFPQRRVGKKGEGRFERITWDQALDEIASRLHSTAREFGSEAIVPYSYAGTLGLLNNAGMDRRFFHRLEASRLDRTICSAAGGAALNATLGNRFATEPEQFRHSRLILAWGANVLGTNVHLWPFIAEARRNGAKFYVIDPHRNRTGKLADKHFFINPGSDAALAFGMMHVLIGESLYDADYVSNYTSGFEDLREQVKKYPPQRAAALTGIPAEEIVTLAREYATTRPAVIRLNYGVQRGERGGLSVQAVSLLPALTGSWKEVGGGFQLSTSHAFRLNREGLELANLGRPGRVVNMSKLGSALEQLNDPPVKALIVYNSNPAAIAPDQNSVLRGLRREDLFTVVLEQVQTDTADFADILLPSTTFLEHTDLYLGYGHHYLQLARPVVAAPGEAKSNVEVFRALALRMGFEDACFRDSEEDMIRTLLDSDHPFIKGITLEELDRDHSVRLRVARNGDPFLPFAAGGFATPSGRCELKIPDYTPPVESRFGSDSLRARYPLELISPKNDNSMNSTFGNRPDTDLETAILALHSADAAERGITDGDAVRVFNDRGSCVLKARVDGEVRAGVVAAPAVRAPKRSIGGRGVNALVSERLTDIGGGATFYSCLVQVEKSGD